MFGPSKEHIEIVEGAGGPKPLIVGTRIRVQDIIVWHDKLGMSPGEIVDDYPPLTMADVHAALAYYWDYQEAMERKMAEQHAFVEGLRQMTPNRFEEKLRRLRGD